MAGARMPEERRTAPPLLGDSNTLKHDHHTRDLQLHGSQGCHVAFSHAFYVQYGYCDGGRLGHAPLIQIWWDTIEPALWAHKPVLLRERT